MMEGPNFQLTREIGETYKIPIIISGGVSNITDIEKIKGLETFGIVGAICGRAVYSLSLIHISAPTSLLSIA